MKGVGKRTPPSPTSRSRKMLAIFCEEYRDAGMCAGFSLFLSRLPPSSSNCRSLLSIRHWHLLTLQIMRQCLSLTAVLHSPPSTTNQPKPTTYNKPIHLNPIMTPIVLMERTFMLFQISMLSMLQGRPKDLPSVTVQVLWHVTVVLVTPRLSLS